MEKQVLSIRVSAYFYNQLKSEVGKGNMSTFIERIVSKELGEKGRKLEQEYTEVYSNPRMIREAKQWEKAEIKSWLSYEKSKQTKEKKQNVRKVL